ncbi:hypothetical protein TSOC_012815 [Tetrabaena socialis]|uniref:Uncharacterized protein n=1 Tax=Tetrabaena socialis TaxID=47790 RepID=A0A2J7ZM08_9CHLO|nr:hypothetical protein TSOC_012815 [Tetrabaena socialis]|eukprot:PNH01309.1 hypothetical protein TSOC_012815 [Tetrabaena socialis]
MAEKDTGASETEFFDDFNRDPDKQDMRALPDDHPLKELFFSAFDPAMFHEVLTRFISQVRTRKEGPGEWDADAAEGECDEDHSLE